MARKVDVKLKKLVDAVKKAKTEVKTTEKNLSLYKKQKSQISKKPAKKSVKKPSKKSVK